MPMLSLQDSNSNTAEAQIFILDTRHKVNVVFEDPAKEVEAKRSTVNKHPLKKIQSITQFQL